MWEITFILRARTIPCIFSPQLFSKVYENVFSGMYIVTAIELIKVYFPKGVDGNGDSRRRRFVRIYSEGFVKFNLVSNLVPSAG